MLFCFLGQKGDLEQHCKRDNRLLDYDIEPKKTIYHDSGHRTYRAKWDAALDLRDKAKNLPNRNKEDAWNGLMTNFLFEGISYQASEWVDHLSLRRSKETDEDSQGIYLTDLLSW